MFHQKKLTKGNAAVEVRQDPESAISDVLTDLRHYCDLLGLDFAEIDGRGYRNYSAEVVEERQLKAERTKKAKTTYVCDDNCRNIGCNRAHAQAEQSDAEEISDRGREDF